MKNRLQILPIASGLILAAAACSQFGSSASDPSANYPGPHVTTLLAMPNAPDLTNSNLPSADSSDYFGHVIVDDKQLFAVEIGPNTMQYGIWSVPKDGSSPQEVWTANNISTSSTTVWPRLAADSSYLYWTTPPAATFADGGSTTISWEVLRAPKTGMVTNPTPVAKFANGYALGIAIGPAVIFVAAFSNASGSSGCQYQFASGTSNSMTTQACPTSLNNQPNAGLISRIGGGAGDAGAVVTLVSNANFVGPFQPNLLLADSENLYWFEATPPYTSGSQWYLQGYVVNKLSQSAPSNSVGVAMAALDISHFPIAMAQDSTNLYIQTSTSVGNNGSSQVVGCSVQRISKTGTDGGAPVELFRDPSTGCSDIKANSSQQYVVATNLSTSVQRIGALASIPGTGSNLGWADLQRQGLVFYSLHADDTAVYGVSPFYLIKVPTAVFP